MSKIIRDTIGLLHSMVLSGEKTDGTVSGMVKKSLDEIEELEAENKALKEYQKGQDEQLKKLSNINADYSLNKSVLKAEIEALKETLTEIQKYNRKYNGLEFYLFKLVNWALGEEIEKPNPKNYGLEPKP